MTTGHYVGSLGADDIDDAVAAAIADPATATAGGLKAAYGAWVSITDPRFGGAALAIDGTADWRGVLLAASAALPNGGRVVVPPGVYGLSAPVSFPGTVFLQGAAPSFAGFAAAYAPTRGSIFRALPGFAPGTQIDGTQSNGMLLWAGTAYPPNATAGTAEGNIAGGGAEFIICDGAGIANCFQTSGRRAHFRYCWATRPKAVGYIINGQNGEFHFCKASCAGAASSHGFWVANWDTKIVDCQARDYTVAAVSARSGFAGLEVEGGHYYSASGGNALRVFSTFTEQGLKFVNVNCDSSKDAPQISVTTGGTGYIEGMVVAGCCFYSNGDFTTDLSVPVIQANTPAGTYLDLLVADCTAANNNSSSTQSYKSWVDLTGPALRHTVLSNLLGSAVGQLWTSGVGWRPNQVNGVSARTRNGGAVKMSENRGTASIASGATIAHGLGVVPNHASVATTVSGHRAQITAADATNLTVAIQDASGTTVAAAESVYWSAAA